MKKIAVMASGYGSNLEALIESIKPLKINGKIDLVFSDKKTSHALQRAKKNNIESVCFGPEDFSSRKEYDKAIIDVLYKKNIDVILLAGYMLLLGTEMVRKFKNRIINIHPSLLPSFKGLHGIKDAFEYGVKVTGVTVHFVDEALDNGPIIIQKSLVIRENMEFDELEAEIHKIEHEIYPIALKYFCEDLLKIKGRKVIIG